MRQTSWGVRIGRYLKKLDLASFTLTKKPSADPTKNPTSVLDPTKIPAWNIIRYPPIKPGTIIQGRPRHPNSNAAREFQRQEGARLRKALKRITHGRNIFVYSNMRTSQVVYSLTRYLEKNNVLSQMVNHGKKTVPATLRKDMWVPYFSVHFDDAKVGLRAYQLLREFSMQRQLAPPKELVSISKEWLDKRRPKLPEEAKEFDEEYEKRVGLLMKKRDRARAVMNQKATSVADIAAVIAIQEEELKNGFASGKRGYLTRTARQRRRRGRAVEKRASEAAAKRVQEFEEVIKEIENFKERTGGFEIGDAAGVREYNLEPQQVKILWNDIHDAQWAKSWPDRVSHGILSLTKQHIIPGQKRDENDEILADHDFAEAKPAVSEQQANTQ